MYMNSDSDSDGDWDDIEQSHTIHRAHATSDDFARLMGLTSFWWTQTALGKHPCDARPWHRNNFERSSKSGPVDIHIRSRVENFATQLKQQGFAIVQLCPEDLQAVMEVETGKEEDGKGKPENTDDEKGEGWFTEEPCLRCRKCVFDKATGDEKKCKTKLTKYFPIHDYDPLLPNEVLDPKDYEWETCDVCYVKEITSAAEADPRSISHGPSTVFWRCEECAETYICDACYQDNIKFQSSTKETFGYILPRAIRSIQRMLDLEPTTKFGIKSDQPDDGYKYLEGDKEIFHWSGTSRNLFSQERFGRQGDISMLRSRLLSKYGRRYPFKHLPMRGRTEVTTTALPTSHTAGWLPSRSLCLRWRRRRRRVHRARRILANLAKRERRVTPVKPFITVVFLCCRQFVTLKNLDHYTARLTKTRVCSQSS